MYIFIYLVADGEAFVIIIMVIERKFEKRKHASLDQSVLSKILNHYSKRNFIIYDCITVRENSFYTLRKTNEQ